MHRNSAKSLIYVNFALQVQDIQLLIQNPTNFHRDLIQQLKPMQIQKQL